MQLFINSFCDLKFITASKFIRFINLYWLLPFILLIACKSTYFSNNESNLLELKIQKIINQKSSFEPSKERAIIISVIQFDGIQSFIFPDHGDEIINARSNIAIGGLTKVFMIALFRQLETKGLINLDTKLNSLLPIPFRNIHFDELNLLDLLNHHTGIPKIPNNFGSIDEGYPYNKYTKKDLLHYFADLKPSFKKEFSYSHTNFALLEVALEEKFQTPIKELMDKHIFKSLNMNNSFIYTNDTAVTFMNGYQRNDEISSFERYLSFGGALGAVSNLEELVIFAQRVINTDNYNFGDAIYQYPAHVKRVKMQGGWYLLKERDNQFLLHAGHSTGHYAFMAFEKSKKVGVVICSNSAEGIDFIGVDIIRELSK